MTGRVELHLPTASGRFGGDQLALLTAGFGEAVDLASAVLKLDGVDVFAIHAPDMTIPGWGCGGYTYSENSVVLALDPLDHLTISKVRATLVHEFHHVVREAGPGCGTSLRERIVSEGLAMLFEEQVLGEASEFAHQVVSDEQTAQVVQALDQDPADDGRWFFHADDMPLWLGYTVGYRWARSYAEQQGTNAAALVDVLASTITSPIEFGSQ